ncbi:MULTISPECIES: type II toxin-antitoxin system Phd/YefM family antitoxin [Aliarcobacter]|uniref:type II toxin-antitoxin system Phd/YefM family antitoxin n=1 Tax=Aliarcobacter TaxID=2321111 RepID=UPI00112F42E9|nr:MULTISPECIES: type II toxin-antitoxin system Phd/YefM family antitoxin [Aliarcobacter]MCT7486793.1 type II toxin-antitoxin system Phd/YefM family antitoxin [Aliarcobacter cryaerophilus]MCT7491197.1 type II toxin-antitoxin system Phd/YefM family antitoxin [Aliarcobacter cryaerophilus]MCT7583147.1 type II toxin-antitoxin system Phd/YefM family antitoxin [Aliarcobacter butzleri]
MVSYTQNELLSITDFTKSISKILGDIKERTVEKVGVLKNNKLEAVVISTQEYERLKEIEELMSNIEHKEIYNIVQDRVKTPKSKYLSMEDMAKKFNIDTKSL